MVPPIIRPLFTGKSPKMTPAARLSAAITILDSVLAGAPAERALTNWGRGSRFAGSGDRAAVRDLVYEALRCRRSRAALGGGETGRGLVIGAFSGRVGEAAALCTGTAHAPQPLTRTEAALLANPPMLDPLVALDCPDWLAPQLATALGPQFTPVMSALRHRAPVFLRVNQRLATPSIAIAALALEDIVSKPHPLASFALEVIGNTRKIQSSRAFLDGMVELQDVASQAIVAALPATGRVLDYCAGGGGKALALAAAGATVFAHDADPRRMHDLPSRAERAGVRITLLHSGEVLQAGPFDLVLVDVPCTGSGSWRRAPEAKWSLTAERLAELLRVQAGILDTAADYVAKLGYLAYVTCSLLTEENGDQIAAFLRRSPGWAMVSDRTLTPLDGGDGFYLALLKRE